MLSRQLEMIIIITNHNSNKTYHIRVVCYVSAAVPGTLERGTLETRDI